MFLKRTKSCNSIRDFLHKKLFCELDCRSEWQIWNHKTKSEEGNDFIRSGRDKTYRTKKNRQLLTSPNSFCFNLLPVSKLEVGWSGCYWNIWITEISCDRTLVRTHDISSKLVARWLHHLVSWFIIFTLFIEKMDFFSRLLNKVYQFLWSPSIDHWYQWYKTAAQPGLQGAKKSPKP